MEDGRERTGRESSKQNTSEAPLPVASQLGSARTAPTKREEKPSGLPTTTATVVAVRCIGPEPGKGKECD